MKLKKLLYLLPVLIVMFLAAGCIPAEFYFRPLPENPAAPVPVAAFLPLSGSNRIYAEQMSEGLRAAESRINRNHGIGGRRLKLYILDTAGSEEGTATALKKAEKLGVIAAIAGFSTEEVSRLIKHADRLQMPMIIPLATSDYHTDASPFVYRNCFSDLQQMEVLAAHLYHWRKMSRGAVVTDSANDAEYSRGIARNFTQAIRDTSGTITINTVLNAKEMISNDQLNQLLSTEPEFIMISGSGKRAAEILKKLREAGFRGIICGSDSWDDDQFFETLTGTEAGECIYPALFNPENTSREFREFQKEFRQKFYHKPGVCETQSFDALVFLAIGLENADNLVDFDFNWRKIRNFPGAAAYYTMGKKGALDRTIYLKSLGVDRDGEKLRVYPRLSSKMQYSKLNDYRVLE